MGDLSTYNTIHDILLTSYSDLIQKVNEENDEIDKNINNYEQQHSIDYKKSEYEYESTANLQIIYNYLFYIYYFIAFIFSSYLLMKYGLFKIHILLIIPLVLFFPFLIIPVENFLKNVGVYIYSLLTQNVFQTSII